MATEEVEKETKKKSISINLEKVDATLEDATNVLAALGEEAKKAEADGWEITSYSVNNW